jgi:hypothetical protein
MIKLELEIAETNLILTALGQMPWVQVQSLIPNIQAQAKPQLPESKKDE